LSPAVAVIVHSNQRTHEAQHERFMATLQETQEMVDLPEVML